MMKKLLTFVLAFSIALFAAPGFPIQATAAGLGDEEAFTQDFMQAAGISEEGTVYIQTVALLGDTFYAYLDNLSVYTWKPGESVPALLCKLPEPPQRAFLSYEGISSEDRDKLFNTVSYIAAGDGALWGFNVFSGKAGQITNEGIAWLNVKLDISLLNPNAAAYPRRVAYSFVQDGGLFLFVSLDDGWGAAVREYELLRYDLSTGSYSLFDTQGAQGICPYTPGSLLMLRAVKGNTYCLSVMNLSTGDISDLPYSLSGFQQSSALGGLAYDASSGSIYITTQSQVFASQSDASFKAVAFVPASGITAESPAWILPDGRYAVCYGGIYVRQAQEQLAKKTLRIKAGSYNRAIYDDFVKENPDILVAEINELATADDISQSVRTGIVDADIYQINLDHAYMALVRKGYVADMSASEIIGKDVLGMYPSIQRLIMDEQNHPAAYPVALRLVQTYVNKGFWSLAFGDNPLPVTYDEFMDAMLIWEREYADDYPDIGFVMNFDHAYWVRLLIEAYVQQCDQTGSLPDLNDPVLIRVLKKLEQVCAVRKSDNRSTSFVSMDEWGDRSQIFNVQYDEALLYDEKRASLALSSYFLYDINPNDVTPCPLAFQEGKPQNTRASMQVWVIHPTSPNIDAALRFVEYAARIKNNPRVYYALHPDISEPYEDPKFDTYIKDMKRKQAELQEALLSAEGTDRRDLEDVLKYVEDWLNNRENQRWLISSDMIAKYRLVAPSIRFYEDSLYLGASGNLVQQQMQKLCERYAGGQMDLNLFIDEMNKMIKMVSLESE